MSESRVAIRVDEHGVYRVAATRVMLESIVYPYLNGESPQGIRSQYPALTIEEINDAIAFFEANRAEVEIYLERQEMLWLQRRAEQDRNPSPVVKRLRAFRDRCERRQIPMYSFTPPVPSSAPAPRRTR